MIAELPVSTHIFAFTRNDVGLVMPIARRIEFCVNNECLATFISTSLDMAMLEQYFVFGSPFIAIKALKQLRVVGRKFNFIQQSTIEQIERFDISTYDFCEMIRALYWNGTDWRFESINKDLASWLNQDTPLDPVLLRFIVSPFGERQK